VTFPRSTDPRNSEPGQPQDLLRPRFTVPETEVAATPSDALPPLSRYDEPVGRDPRTMPTPPEKCANVIASGARWKGTLTLNDSVRIEGQMTGDIDAGRVRRHQRHVQGRDPLHRAA
jgi:hypothetical protein